MLTYSMITLRQVEYPIKILVMNFANLFRIALKALGNNKFRGFLTMLGTIIGVGSVITMLAIGQGSKKSIQAEIS